MSGSACSAAINTVYASWNNIQFGLVTGVSYTITIGEVPMRNEDKTGMGCRPMNMSDCTATVTYLVPPTNASSFDPISNGHTTGNLVFRVRTNAGTRDITMRNMIPRGITFALDRENPPNVYVQHYVCQDDMVTNPVSGDVS